MEHEDHQEKVKGTKVPVSGQKQDMMAAPQAITFITP